MSEVDCHTEIGSAGLGNSEKCRRSVAQKAMGPRLVRLVLDTDPAGGVVLGDGANAGHLPVPGLGVVKLEAVVKAILTEPDGHEVGTHGTSRIDPTHGEVNGLLPDRCIRMCEGPCHNVFSEKIAKCYALRTKYVARGHAPFRT